MKTLKLILFLLLFPLPVFSQTQFDVSRLPIGSTVRWTTHNGNTSITLRQRSGDLFLFDFVRDGSKGSPLKVRFWSNRNGQSVKAIIGNETVTYSPSDCTLTVGKCTYRETLSDGRSRKMIWRGTERGGVWSYKLYHTSETTANLTEEGNFTVDAAGIYIDRDYVVYSNGKAVQTWSRRKR